MGGIQKDFLDVQKDFLDVQKDFLDAQKAFFGDVYSKFLPNGTKILGGLSPPFPNFTGAIAPLAPPLTAPLVGSIVFSYEFETIL